MDCSVFMEDETQTKDYNDYDDYAFLGDSTYTRVGGCDPYKSTFAKVACGMSEFAGGFSETCQPHSNFQCFAVYDSCNLLM